MEVAYALEALRHLCRPLRLSPLRLKKESDSRDLIDACMRIAAWADYCREPATAIGYVEAALELAELAPLRLGRNAARRGEPSQAQRWFSLAIKLGEKTGRWDQVVKAWTQLGKLHRMSADHEQTAKAHGTALTLARIHRLRPQEAIALHNLAVLAFEQLDSAKGLVYARLALDAYRGDLDGIRKLANDLAWYWMTSENAYARALPIFEALLLEEEDADDDRIDFTANMGRAAAGAQNSEKFERACAAVRELAGRAAPSRVAGALLDLAEGAVLLGRSDQAKDLAVEAKGIAKKHKVKKWEREADKLLDRLEKQVHRAPPVGLPPLVEVRLNELAERLLKTLRAR